MSRRRMQKSQRASIEQIEERILLTNYLVSTASSGTSSANDDSIILAVSQDGKSLVVASQATNLVSGVTDANGVDDLYLIDVSNPLNPTKTLITHQWGSASTATSGGGLITGLNGTGGVMISADGSLVVYTHTALNNVGTVTRASGNSTTYLCG